MAAEVKDILNSIKQGQSSGGDEAHQLKQRLAELEAVVEQRARDTELLEKSLHVCHYLTISLQVCHHLTI